MKKIGRREFALVTVAGAPLLGGCVAALPPVASAVEPSREKPAPPETAAAFEWRKEERKRVDDAGPDFEVVVRGCFDSNVLRTRAREVPAGVDLSTIESRMIRTMTDSGGVGIAGPQVGLYLRVAVLQLDYKTDSPRTIFVRNPVIVERSDETAEGYEGCLSIPGVGGLVRRNSWIKVEHDTLDGETVSVEAEGYNAVLWQHELDHLDGILYVDKLLGDLMPMDEVRRLRKEMEGEGEAEKQAGLDLLEGASWIVPA